MMPEATLLRPATRRRIRERLEAVGVHISGKAEMPEIAAAVARAMNLKVPSSMLEQTALIARFAKGDAKISAGMAPRPFIPMKLGREWDGPLERIAEYQAFYKSRSRYG